MIVADLISLSILVEYDENEYSAADGYQLFMYAYSCDLECVSDVIINDDETVTFQFHGNVVGLTQHIDKPFDGELYKRVGVSK